MKRLSGYLLLPLFYGILFTGNVGCGGGHGSEGSNRVAKGGKVQYGGDFRMNETENFRSLFPLDISENVGWHIASQVYEGLVKFNQKDLSIVPCIALHWDALDSFTHYVFHLRNDVYFQDDSCFRTTDNKDGKGRQVTASDVKYCFDRLCTASPSNQQFNLTFKDKVVGANDYFSASEKGAAPKGGVPGITVINDSTIDIRLTKPIPGFLNAMAMPGCWIYPKEAYEKYGENMRTQCVGTGPFRVESIHEGTKVVLKYNPGYWAFDTDGNRLPYLDFVEFSFIKDKRQEILAFRNNQLDMVFRLPVEMAHDIMGELNDAATHAPDFTSQGTPAMSLTYYGFQTKLPPFNNPKVRQAFNYAIDRNAIAQKILLGEVNAASYGVVPPGIAGYNSQLVQGYTFDKVKAAKLLADAGYPNGRNFPEITLIINSGGGDRNIMTAQAVINQLKENLNITVKYDIMPFAQQLETVETGKSLFWRSGWNADYPDPESFLSVLYGKNLPDSMSTRSYPNSMRYKSTQFDSLFDLALVQPDAAKRADLFMHADQIAIDDAAIMPIYYEINDRLIHKNVRGFDINPMEYRDMSVVWLDNSDPNQKGGNKADTAKK